MSELILNALVQLFALISDIHDDTVITSREKDIVRLFLARHLNSELVRKYMKLFEEYLTSFNSERVTKDSLQQKKRTTLNSMRILGICDKINQELQQKQKIYVLVQLIDYISLGDEISENELDFLHSVASAFYISDTEYCNIKSFIMGSVFDICDKRRILIIDDTREGNKDDIKYLFKENLHGTLSFLHIVSTNTYVLRYSGTADLYLNGQNMSAGHSYIFDHGSSIRGTGMSTIYYTEIVSIITDTSFEEKITLDANDVSYRFSNSENGIHNLNLHEESGRLVGILGGSGVGKSTTLSILNGTLKPQIGEVLINGFNLYDESDKEKLKGIIGFVPQDDLLIEDLTVFQNLYYNAKLCLNNLEENEIVDVVNKTLVNFDLEETRNLKVGNPLKKIISGGQRKRVNIALELMREPTILFVDEPTSGLSSVDSEMVMNLLKAQTYKGKLVIINIHQPNSDIYKMFDKVMIIDRGGYQVYYGNPTEAIVYFKKHSNHANPDEDQCIQCGTINTDQILQIVESKVVDERGRPTRLRKVSPVEWAHRLRESGMLKKISEKSLKQLPENNFSIPGFLKQSGIFFMRDILSKLADRQYIIISLLGPPLLSLLLAYFTRFSTEGGYTFSENENIPSYMFMCVITSLFFGLMVSSEEIVKDRKILKRESFLNLSWLSYLNSKIMILFIISATQTISFAVIGNTILGIKGMTLGYWLVLFTTSCFSNILGLNLSSAFNSVITIYIIIPFIIIPQLLFSGVLVKFDKLHIGSSNTREFVPVIGDIMTARWSFEALAVKQFRDNNYERHFFRYNMLIEEYLSYKHIVDDLEKELLYCIKYKDSIDYLDNVRQKYFLINKYVDELSEKAAIRMPDSLKASLKTDNQNRGLESGARTWLMKNLKPVFINEWGKIRDTIDLINKSLIKSLGDEEFYALKTNYENKRLKELITEPPKELIVTIGDRKIPKSSPGYLKATSKYGRAHFYAPVKIIGNKEIDTFKFNLLAIWLVTIIMYIALYFKVLYKLIRYFGSLKLQKSET